jgi:hypothetical protein
VINIYYDIEGDENPLSRHSLCRGYKLVHYRRVAMRFCWLVLPLFWGLALAQDENEPQVVKIVI